MEKWASAAGRPLFTSRNITSFQSCSNNGVKALHVGMALRLHHVVADAPIHTILECWQLMRFEFFESSLDD
jgi:hypothetical protein